MCIFFHFILSILFIPSLSLTHSLPFCIETLSQVCRRCCCCFLFQIMLLIFFSYMHCTLRCSSSSAGWNLFFLLLLLVLSTKSPIYFYIGVSITLLSCTDWLTDWMIVYKNDWAKKHSRRGYRGVIFFSLFFRPLSEINLKSSSPFERRKKSAFIAMVTKVRSFIIFFVVVGKFPEKNRFLIDFRSLCSFTSRSKCK